MSEAYRTELTVRKMMKSWDGYVTTLTNIDADDYLLDTKTMKPVSSFKPKIRYNITVEISCTEGPVAEPFLIGKRFEMVMTPE